MYVVVLIVASFRPSRQSTRESVSEQNPTKVGQLREGGLNPTRDKKPRRKPEGDGIDALYPGLGSGLGLEFEKRCVMKINRHGSIAVALVNRVRVSIYLSLTPCKITAFSDVLLSRVRRSLQRCVHRTAAAASSAAGGFPRERQAAAPVRCSRRSGEIAIIWARVKYTQGHMYDISRKNWLCVTDTPERLQVQCLLLVL